MAAVLGDLLQITDFQTLAAQQVLNVYYYRVTSPTGFTDDGYATVIDEFIATVMDVVRSAQSDALSHDAIEIRNLSNGLDFETRAFNPGSKQGLVASQSLPSYVTYTWRLIRESLATRNGYKRFAGVSETQGEGNSYSPGSTVIANINAALAADLVSGIVTLVEPVIVKRPIAVPAGSYIYSSIGAADFRGVGSQNTRKPGYGI